MQSTIVPLVKNKNGDLTSLDNYRAIAISNALSKLFETVILNIYSLILTLINFSLDLNVAYQLVCTKYI